MIKFVVLLLLAPYCFADGLGSYAAAHYEKGEQYYRQNEADKAKAEWEKSLEFVKNYEVSLKALKRLEEEKFVDNKDDAFNDIAKEFYLKGLAFYRTGNLISASKEWEKGLSVSPGSKQLLLFLSKTKSPEPSGDKKVHVSSVSVPKTIELKPVEKKAVPVPKRPEKRILNTDDLEKEQKMYLEGLKCYSQGKFSEALKMFEQVLKINPDNEKAKKNIEQIIQKEKK